MDVKLLADGLMNALAPALPYLVSGGQGLVEKVGQALGEKGPELVNALWAKLRPKIEEKREATAAVKEVAQAPEEPDAQAALRLQLRKILEADPDLAAEVARLLETAGPRASYHAVQHGSGTIVQGEGNVVAGPGGMAAGRDIKSR